jgi:hypothetical protein
MEVKLKHGILLICKNEINALKVVCEDLKESLNLIADECYVLFVDGRSDDGSYEYLKNQKFNVHIQESEGIRAAITEGVKILMNQNVTSITFAQPDGNCDLKQINKLIEKFKNVDSEMIIGSRYLAPATSEDDTIISKIGNKYFTLLISFVSGFRYTDSMVGYRIFSTNILDKIDLLSDKYFRIPEFIFRTHLAWDPLLSTLSPLLNIKITEIPISEPKRIGGVVKKQTIRWGLGYSFQVILVLIKKIFKQI